MNKPEARLIANTATYDSLRQMFLNAQKGIINWEERAVINKSMSKGTAFNILSSVFRDEFEIQKVHFISKLNSIREFGEFYPGYEKPVKKKKNLPPVMHQPPKFLNE